RFDELAARDRLCAQFGVLSLEAFGCAHLPQATGAAGAILSYLEETNSRLLPTLAGLRTYTTAGGMALGGYTRRNLELVRSARAGTVGPAPQGYALALPAPRGRGVAIGRLSRCSRADRPRDRAAGLGTAHPARLLAGARRAGGLDRAGAEVGRRAGGGRAPPH